MSCCAPSFSRQTNPIKHCGFTIPAGLIKHAVNLYKIKAGVISTLAHCSRLLERRACKSRFSSRVSLSSLQRCHKSQWPSQHKLLSQSPITSIRAPRALRAASLLNDRISRDGARALPPAVRQAEETPVNLGTLAAWTTAQRYGWRKDPLLTESQILRDGQKKWAFTHQSKLISLITFKNNNNNNTLLLRKYFICWHMHQKVTFTMCSSVCLCKWKCFISVIVDCAEQRKRDEESVRVSQHFCRISYGPLESVWPYRRTTSAQISSHLKCLFSVYYWTRH